MKQISKEDLQSATTPGDGWFIIEAAGQHATRRGEVEFTQNLTPEVLAGIVEAGVPAEGLPIDRDHLSLDERNSTEALGWLRELAMCDGQLAGRIEWTPLGLPLIQGRVYKHFSTVYPPPGEQLAVGEYMPERLIGLALTNQPNNKEGQPPITNSRERVGEVRGTRLRSCGATPRQANDPSSPLRGYAGSDSPSGYAEANSLRSCERLEEDEAGYLWPREDFSEGEVPEEAENNTNEEPTMYSPELLSALGLPEGATEADVLAAVQKLKQSAEVANAAVKKAEAAEAEAVINAAERENGVELSEEEKEVVSVPAPEPDANDPLAPLLAAGSYARKTFNRKEHVVYSLGRNRYSYNGAVFASLSAVACHIAGYKLSGRKFFSTNTIISSQS